MRARQRLSAVFAALLAAGAAGCANTEPSGVANVTTLYDPTLVWHATRHGFPTGVHGNPFALATEEAHKKVIASLELPSRFEPTRFVARGTDAPSADYRLMVLFNPAPETRRFQAACGDAKSFAFVPRGDLILIHAAFCVGARALSETSQLAPAVADPDDPVFRQVLNATIDTLLPSYSYRNSNIPRP